MIDVLLESAGADQQLQKVTCLRSCCGYLSRLLFRKTAQSANLKPTSPQHSEGFHAALERNVAAWHGKSLTGTATDNNEPWGHVPKPRLPWPRNHSSATSATQRLVARLAARLTNADQVPGHPSLSFAVLSDCKARGAPWYLTA